jgi:hypothetical protein
VSSTFSEATVVVNELLVTGVTSKPKFWFFRANQARAVDVQ